MPLTDSRVLDTMQTQPLLHALASKLTIDLAHTRMHARGHTHSHTSSLLPLPLPRHLWGLGGGRP